MTQRSMSQRPIIDRTRPPMLTGWLSALVLAVTASSAAPPVRADPPDPPRVRVWRKEGGFVRVPAAKLKALGLPEASRLAVTRRGRPVPVLAPAPDGDLVFLAIGTATPPTTWAPFTIHVRAAPEPPTKVLPAAPIPEAVPITALRTLKDDRLYGPLAAAEPEVYDGERPTWFLAKLSPGGGVAIGLDPRGAAPDAPQRLEVQVFATHVGPLKVHATWGGRDLGPAETPGAAGGGTLVWNVPAAAVPEDTEPLVLKDLSPAPAAAESFDVTDDRGTLWVDQITLLGPVSPVVDASLRSYPVTAGTVVTLVDDRTEDLLPDLLQGGDVYAACVAPDGSPAQRPIRETGAEEVSFAIGDVPERTVLVVSRSAEEAEPQAMPPVSDPVAAAQDAAHLILAVPALLEPAMRLARHRTSRGLPSVVVNVADVYETFAQGERDPEAIREYLLALFSREGSPLKHVVLAGDATLDRTDLVPGETIPARMARTKYNGATPADRLYVAPEGEVTGGPAVGRLPFRRAEEMAAYVDRVIAYETKAPADATRRLLRFVTGEGRFSPAIDALIERKVQNLLATSIPAAFDVEMTYANPRSPYFWPAADLSDKLVADLNAGALFFTYVGHGFAEGFDRVEGHAIFHVSDVPDVAIRGTPPVVFVFACTTAIFDVPDRDGVGEALLRRPGGPLAYFGATRICHPAANAILGQALASRLFAPGAGAATGRTLGEILDAARDEMLAPATPRVEDLALRAMPASRDLTRLFREASWMYGLLGDPALVPALPAEDLAVTAVAPDVGASPDGVHVEVAVSGPLPDGARVEITLEVVRSQMAHEFDEGAAAPAAVKENHRRANDKSLTRATATAADGRANALLVIPQGFALRDVVAKAWAIAEGEVHQGAAQVSTR